MSESHPGSNQDYLKPSELASFAIEASSQVSKQQSEDGGGSSTNAADETPKQTKVGIEEADYRFTYNANSEERFSFKLEEGVEKLNHLDLIYKKQIHSVENCKPKGIGINPQTERAYRDYQNRIMKVRTSYLQYLQKLTTQNTFKYDEDDADKENHKDFVDFYRAAIDAGWITIFNLNKIDRADVHRQLLDMLKEIDPSEVNMIVMFSAICATAEKLKRGKLGQSADSLQKLTLSHLQL